MLAEELADAPESVPGVRLVCDARVSLFSTDFRPMQVTEARAKALDVRHSRLVWTTFRDVGKAAVERLHESCGCRVRDMQFNSHCRPVGLVRWVRGRGIRFVSPKWAQCCSMLHFHLER